MTKTTGHAFDRRDTKCKRCGKLFRREDVNGAGICKWCWLELLEKARYRMVARRMETC